MVRPANWSTPQGPKFLTVLASRHTPSAIEKMVTIVSKTDDLFQLFMDQRPA